MIEKYLTVSTYLLLGTLLALSPIIAQYKQISFKSDLSESKILNIIGILFTIGAMLIGFKIVAPSVITIFVIVVVSISAVERHISIQGIFACLCGLIITATLPWWRYTVAGDFDISIAELNITAEICVICLILVARELVTGIAPIAMPVSKRLAIVAFAICAVILSFDTGPTQNSDIRLTAWHHWGAFIGPAELLFNGLRIFRDFPVQYGFGPTLLIAGSCGDNCWIGMYYLAGLAAFLLSMCLLYIATCSRIRSNSGFFVTVFALLALFCSIFFWAAYPPRLSVPMITPSVSGLRFLPPVALVFAILWAERRAKWGDRQFILIHFLWAIGALWSPESLFITSFIWWPYFCWRAIKESVEEGFAKTILRAVTTLTKVLLTVVASFIIGYWLIYHSLPSGRVYLGYMLYPPGPMPINPKGPVWFSVVTLLIGTLSAYTSMRSNKNDLELKQKILALLLGYGSLLYCMGRSHDNNFLNIAPFMALILITVLTSDISNFLRMAGASLLAGYICWESVFGWSAWSEAIQASRFIEFRPHRLAATFSYEDPVSLNILVNTMLINRIDGGSPSDASYATTQIGKISSDPTTIIDNFFMLNNQLPTDAWNAFDDPANFYFFPDEMRREFIANTAAKLQRSGWLVIDKKILQPWLDDYLVAYDVAEDLDFGSYRAFHMRPKLRK